MLTSFLASLLAVPLLADAAAIQHRGRSVTGGLKVKTYKPHAFLPRSADAVTSNHAVLQRSNSGASHSHALKVIRATSDIPSAALNGADGVEYLVPISWGSQSFQSILDSGSSDTWLISSSFTCQDSTGKEQTASACGFGTGYSGTIDEIPSEHFNITYGDGEFVTGKIGTTEVTLAGITVPKQTVALGTAAYWQGGGVASGLIGLAYPAITSAFSSSNVQKPYDPIFTTMYKNNLTSASFSLAIMRGSTGGYIAFGGLPPVSGVNGTFASAPIEVVAAVSSTSDFSFYAIVPSAFTYGGKTQSSSSQYIVDSGTTLNYLTSSLAKSVNAAFSPAATLDASQGIYTVDCTAKPPAFGVVIGGTTFYNDASDMILGQDDTSNQIDGKCISAIQDSGSLGLSILGDAWLKSVIAVFDVGASEMRFAAHSY